MRGNLEKRGKTWSIRFTYTDPQTNERKYKRKSGYKTKRDARNALAKIISEYENNMYVETNKLTVGEYLSQWFDDHKNNIARTTAIRYKVILEQHIIPALGNTQLQKLTAAQIQRFLSKHRKSGRKDNKKSCTRELSASSVHYTYRVLRCALNRAAALQLIMYNPIVAVRPPTVHRTKPVLLPKEQVCDLLAGLKNTYLYLPAYVAVHTGLRLGEVLGLCWENVNLEAGTALICTSLPYQTKANKYYFKAPKTSTSIRTIALSSQVVNTLKKVREEHEQLKKVNAAVWADYNLVCCKEDGMPLHPPTISSAFRKAARKLGYKISFHDLRDIYAGLSIVCIGESVKTISSNLGHGSGAITLDRYTGMLNNIQKDAADRLGEFLDSDGDDEKQ